MFIPDRREGLSLEEQIKSGYLYDGSVNLVDPELQAKFDGYKELLYEFNHTRPSEIARRTEILREVLAEVGENYYIEPPFYANWGCNTHIGNNFYANFGFTVVDDTDIYIGDDVMIGPHVTLSAGTHPVDPDLRQKMMQFNIPIHIGNRVWIGAHAVVMPGITIGNDSVIGAGSVVTKDVPEGVVAVGNPCKVLREIGPRDKEFYYKDWRI